MTTNEIENEKLAKRFFTLQSGYMDVWICVCDNARKRKYKWGWSNLVDHIKRAHIGKLEMMKTLSTT